MRPARDKGGRALNEAKGGALRRRPVILGLIGREQTTLLKGGHDLPCIIANGGSFDHDGLGEGVVKIAAIRKTVFEAFQILRDLRLEMLRDAALG